MLCHSSLKWRPVCAWRNGETKAKYKSIYLIPIPILIKTRKVLQRNKLGVFLVWKIGYLKCRGENKKATVTVDKWLVSRVSWQVVKESLVFPWLVELVTWPSKYLCWTGLFPVATSRVFVDSTRCLWLSDVTDFPQHHRYCRNTYPEMQNALELQEVHTWINVLNNAEGVMN